MLSRAGPKAEWAVGGRDASAWPPEGPPWAQKRHFARDAARLAAPLRNFLALPGCVFLALPGCVWRCRVVRFVPRGLIGQPSGECRLSGLVIREARG
jgi:hypothetical protein